MELNTREVALLVWLAVVVLGSFFGAGTRRSLRGVVRAALTPKIVVVFLFIGGWGALTTWVFYFLGIWTPSFIKDAALLTFGPVLTAVVNQENLRAQRSFLRVFVELVSVTAAVELLVNLVTFPLWVELLLVPVGAVIGALTVLPSMSQKGRRAATFLLTLFGLSLLAYSVVAFCIGATSSDYLEAGRLVLYTVLALTLAVPCALVTGFWSTFDTAFVWVRFDAQKAGVRPWRGRLAIVQAFALHPALLGQIEDVPYRLRSVGRAGTYSAARTEVRTMIDAFRKEKEDAESAAADLLRYSGVDGVDSEGRRLDQREFHETREALEWLQTCLVGHYQSTGRFQRSVLDDIIVSFAAVGLPDPHGIQLTIRDDGQAWFAWRRTIGNWIFAVGHSGPDDDWRYDGHEPPSGFPSIGSTWGEAGGTNTANW